MSTLNSLPHWKINDIKHWLRQSDLAHCIHVFRHHQIDDGGLLLKMEDQQIQRLIADLSIRDQIRLKDLIAKTQNEYKHKPITTSDNVISCPSASHRENSNNDHRKGMNDTEQFLKELHTKPNNYGKRWTKSDDRLLLRLVDDNASMEDLTRRFKRTRGGIETRLAALRDPQHPRHPRHPIHSRTVYKAKQTQKRQSKSKRNDRNYTLNEDSATESEEDLGLEDMVSDCDDASNPNNHRKRDRKDTNNCNNDQLSDNPLKKRKIVIDLTGE